jgi:hypothetical protein
MNKLLSILIALCFVAGFVLFFASIALIVCAICGWRIIIFGIALGGMSRADAFIQLLICAAIVVLLKISIVFLMSKIKG